MRIHTLMIGRHAGRGEDEDLNRAQSGETLFPWNKTRGGANLIQSFWSKGDEALLEMGEERHSNCINNRAKAIWEDAKLRGVDFRALGNEPGWHLEISGSEKIVFVGDYGNTVYSVVTLQPLIDQHARTTTYKVQDALRDLTVLIEGRPCNDSMSGEPFESSVTVILDRKKYRRCGKALH